jgi:hypothetical protein
LALAWDLVRLKSNPCTSRLFNGGIQLTSPESLNYYVNGVYQPALFTNTTLVAPDLLSFKARAP